jgi:hypothetical protein
MSKVDVIEKSKLIFDMLWNLEEKLSKLEVGKDLDDIFVVSRSSQINNNNVETASPFKVFDFEGNVINIVDRIDKVFFFFFFGFFFF